MTSKQHARSTCKRNNEPNYPLQCRCTYQQTSDENYYDNAKPATSKNYILRQKLRKTMRPSKEELNFEQMANLKNFWGKAKAIEKRLDNNRHKSGDETDIVRFFRLKMEIRQAARLLEKEESEDILSLNEDTFRKLKEIIQWGHWTEWQQVKPIGFEAPRGGAYNNRKHLKLETPCS